MPVDAVFLDWRREPAGSTGTRWQHSLKDDVASALAAFQARTGLPATHAYVNTDSTGYPPEGCDLIWQATSAIRPNIIRVGVTTGGRL